jgi:hypothetical protein
MELREGGKGKGNDIELTISNILHLCKYRI